MTRLLSYSIPLLLLVSVPALAQDPAPKKPKQDSLAPLLVDSFGKKLDTKQWKVVRFHDTKSDTVAAKDGRLTLSLNTLGTDDSTVKLRGIRSLKAFAIPAEGAPLRVTATLDWNEPVNGCYLTAGFALLPVGMEEDPHRAREAICVEFVGVPPGKNARPFLFRRASGGLRPLFTEGWPQKKRKDRTGRYVKRVRMTLEVTSGSVRYIEDGRKLYEADHAGLAGKVNLLIYVTGHSNYPERTVYFEDVKVERRG